jgi:hypothetical protein
MLNSRSPVTRAVTGLSNAMETQRVFANAVASSELPDRVRGAVSDAQAVEPHCFDDSYIAFLDEQIELNARGDAWTERLRLRRSRLSTYCNRTLIHGRIVVDGVDWSLEVDPETGGVVHWETYQFNDRNAENAP